MIVSIEVCRNVDRVPVAKVSPFNVQTPITRVDADLIQEDAKQLSRVYGSRFHVEVWAWWPELGGQAYHRAYVYVNGRTVQAVGF